MGENAKMVKGYKESRHLDPRFQYLDWAKEFTDKIRVVMGDLKGKWSRRQVVTAKDWADAFDGERRELDDQKGVGRQTVEPFIFNVILSSALGVIFTGFGNYVWGHIAQLLPK